MFQYDGVSKAATSVRAHSSGSMMLGAAMVVGEARIERRSAGDE